MKFFSNRLLTVLFLFFCPLAAAGAYEGQGNFTLSPGDQPGGTKLTATPAPGRVYFFQMSADGLNWAYAPTVKLGTTGTPLVYEVFPIAGQKYFYRLKYTLESNYTAGATGDLDGDALSNLAEITAGTDPFEPDTDGDGMPDGWEMLYNLNPLSNEDANLDSDPGGGDNLTNYQEYQRGTNPTNRDSDDDGLNDYDEVFVYGTHPNSSDTDDDGLEDFAEIFTHGTDPRNWDSDDDTLNDGAEMVTHGTNPLEVDTDGDWMWDDYEIANSLDPNDAADGLLDADNDSLANQLEFVFIDQGYDPFTGNNAAAFPWLGDPDWDETTTQLEFATYLTNPRQPDTDGDGMGDGWEIAHAFNAKLNNRNGGPANHHPDADPDGDGRTNAQEEQMGTNPFANDTDADGVSDGDEDDQGSNPNDPNDYQPPPNGTVPANVTFGDPSTSHSEKYRVRLTPLEGDPGGVRSRTNRDYGTPQTDTFRLPKGAKYKVEIIHVATNPKYRGSPRPDYDYQLEIDDDANCLVVDDPQYILGFHTDSDPFFASGKDATLYVPLFRMKEVSFSGSTIGNYLTSDDTNVTYDAPHWQDGNNDGDAEDPGERKYPIAYVRDTPPTIYGKITVKPSGLTAVSGFSAKIKVTGPGNIKIDPPVAATIGIDELELLPATPSAGNFVKEIDYLNPMTLSWQVEVNNKGHWCVAGETAHRTYVTLGIPATTMRQETLFDIGCQNADGQTVEKPAVAAIWSDFLPDTDGIPRLFRVLPPGATGPPSPMTYYADSANPYGTCNTIEELLTTGDGRCGAFQELMYFVLQVQGIASTRKEVHAPTGVTGGVAAAKADHIAVYGTDPDIIYTGSIRDVFFVRRWTLSTATRWSVTDLSGVPGQGNDDPIGIFEDHALVEYDGEIYDPSYGTGPFASILEWEDASIDGFGVQFITPSLLSSEFKFWTRKLDTKGTPEVTSP